VFVAIIALKLTWNLFDYNVYYGNLLRPLATLDRIFASHFFFIIHNIVNNIHIIIVITIDIAITISIPLSNIHYLVFSILIMQYITT